MDGRMVCQNTINPLPEAMTTLTDEELGCFQWLQDNIHAMALIRTQLDGQNVAAIAALMEDEDGGFVNIIPVAILITDSSDLFERLADPAADDEDYVPS
jgi:hypothetical protein